MADGGSGSGSGSGDGVDSMEEDDDEDRVRSKGPNSSNRGASTNYSGGSTRQPKPAPGSKGSGVSQDVANKPDEDDGIEFAPAGTTATPDVKSTTSSATPADSTQQPLSATKALTRYLVPIVVMWIGNMF